MDIALDLDGVPEFNRGVYDIARRIPPGQTLTYGDIAKRLGGVELSRDVGQALGRNPCPIVVPCHRVLAAGGKPGGFSANGGVVTKLKMLAIEGAVVNHTPRLFALPSGADMVSSPRHVRFVPTGAISHGRGGGHDDCLAANQRPKNNLI